MPNPNITLGGAPTTIFGFSNLDGGDTAGHNTINQLVWDIETILNASPRLLPAGNTWDFTGKTISVATPSSATHAATKAYVDGAVTGGNAITLLQRVEVTTSGASARTFISTDSENKIIEYNSPSAGTFTVPSDATTNFPIGCQINVLQTNTGQLTIVGATSPNTVTVNSTPGLKLRAQWSSATLIKRAANTWVLIGDVTI